MKELENLAIEYQKTHDVLMAKVKALEPLLCVYRGKELYLLRKRINIYYEMACECKLTARLLSCYDDKNESEVKRNEVSY